MLRITDVEKSFAGTRVLDAVSLTLSPGEAVLVHGENGAGKSTLFDVIAGVLEPDRGEVTVARVGYAPAAPIVPEHLFLHEWMDLVAALRGATPRDVDAATETWGLARCTDTRLSALSLGQRRRVVLALAELGDPSLLLLDEPTVGLDEAGRTLLLARVETHLARGGTALLASHEADVAERLGASVVTLERGRISAPTSRARTR